VGGMCPDGGPDARGHREGWGLVCFQNGRLSVDMRGAGGAKDDPRFYQAAWKVARINVERREGSLLVVIAHVRRASPGGLLGAEFTHPLVAKAGERDVAFAHNGTLVGFDMGMEGRLDTAVYLEALLAARDGGTERAFRDAILAMRTRYRPTSLTSLLTDGTALHALRSFAGRPEYYTLFYDHWEEMVVFCSEPILSMHREPVGNGELISVDSDLGITRAEVA